MKVRWNPKQQRFPALTGKLVAQTFRGQIHIQKWPRKRGPSKLAKQRRQVKWFTDANALAKRLWPDQIKLAMIMTKGTGLYPRDLLLRQMSGGIYDLFTGDGVHYQPTSMPREAVVFQGAILENTVPQALTAGGMRTLTWQLPVLDTMGFWSVVNPTRLTIPEGVNVVRLSAGWFTSNVTGEIAFLIVINLNGTTRIARQAGGLNEFVAQVVHRGPFKVVAGDFFEVLVFPRVDRTTVADQATFFTLEALDVD